ncbi:hypothetical protein NMY22_g17562 [Coprinellus aureogranulatus]|nr:hypothetical protein NMY22_g17562 [Coprinellus aureogranulatus]
MAVAQGKGDGYLGLIYAISAHTSRPVTSSATRKKVVCRDERLAALVSGSAVNLEARQSELATCTIRTTPSSTPNPTSGLLEEFTTIFIREYAADLPPGTGISRVIPSPGNAT